MLSVALALPGLHGSHSESSGVPGMGRIREDTCGGEQRLHGVILGRRWAPPFMGGFLLQAAFCIHAYFYIFFKAFSQVITVINFFVAK